MPIELAGNAYPNPDNYPESSFPQEVPPPSSDPDDGDLVTVQYSKEWQPVLMAAVDQLLNPATWEGDDDAKRLAVMRASELKSILRTDVPMLQLRYNPLNCTLEQSYDNGETWEAVPGYEFAIACEIAAIEGNFVDVPGDTMTGPLTMSVLAGAPDNKTHIVQREGDQIGFDALLSSGAWRRLFNPGKQYEITGVNAASPSMQLTDTLVAIRASKSLLYAPAASMRFTGNDAAAAMSLMNENAAAATILRLYNSTQQKVAEVGLDGTLLGKLLDLRAYVSNGTLQQQGKVDSGWIVSDAATRRAYLELMAADYAGAHSALRIEADPTATTGLLIGAYGETPADRPEINVVTPESAVDALLAQLNATGWTDIHIDPLAVGLEPVGQTQWRTCNSAYWVAQILAAIITDVLDNLDTVTWDEIQTGLLDDYQVPFDRSGPIITAIVTDIASEAGLLADLSDPSEIGAQLLATNFTLSGMLDWLDGYGGYAAPTIDVLKKVLVAIWDSNVPIWLQQGQFISAGPCSGVSNCDEDGLLYDFRWSDYGFTIPKGHHVQGLGIAADFTDPIWENDGELRFDEPCEADHLIVTIKANNFEATHPGTGAFEMSIATTDGGVFGFVFNPSANYPDTTVSTHNFPATQTIWGVRWRNDNNWHDGSVIVSIEFTKD